MKIEKLNSEQEKLIAVYREKWNKIIYSTETIDRQKAIAAIKAFYHAFGKKEPEIRFFYSPIEVKNELLGQPAQKLVKQLGSPVLTIPLSAQLSNQLQEKIDGSLWLQLTQQMQPMFNPFIIPLQMFSEEVSEPETQQLGQLWLELSEHQWEHLWEQQQEWLHAQVRQIPGGDMFVQFGNSLWQNFAEPLWKKIGEPIVEEISQQPPIQELQETLRSLSLPWLQMGNGLGLMYTLFDFGIEASLVSAIDFGVSVLGCECDRVKWLALQLAIENCGLIFPFEKTCLVCDRPQILSLDEENRLHAEGKPAIQFADGSSLYFFRGVSLPKKYGTIHPNNWQAIWLLEETNAELRRVLIQGISYGRICQELQAVELDSWREYSLLFISHHIDVEPIYLLKMVCPSTGHIHAIRVPPHLKSAREAIRWANWEVDPEEFAIET